MRKLHHCFWLALLLHLLMLVGFFNFAFNQLHPIYQPESNHKTGKILPAYVYQEPGSQSSRFAEAVSQPLPQPDAAQATQSLNHPIPSKEVILSSEGIFKKYRAAERSQHAGAKRLASITQAASVDAPARVDIRNLASDKAVDMPLLKLLSKATARKLIYPKAAVDFRVTGTAKIGFLLYPDGQVINATVVESSGSGVLDQAALQAIQDISPVANVDAYLKNPKIIIAGIIFGQY